MAQLKDLIVTGSSRLIGDAFAPTANSGDNSTQVATTAFVNAAIASAITSKTQTNKSATLTAVSGTISPDTGYTLMNKASYSIRSAVGTAASSVTVNVPTFGSVNNTDGNVLATVASKSGTAYYNITTSGWIGSNASGTAYVTGNSANFTIPKSTLVANGSKQQSTPTVSINCNNGVISAYAAATSGTANITVTGNGYISNSYGTRTNSTFSLTQSSTGTLSLTTKTGTDSNYQNNLYVTPSTSAQTIMNRNEFLVANHLIVNAMSGGTVVSAGNGTAVTTSAGLVTNISNAAVNASDKILFATGANGKYRLNTTGSGGAKVGTAGYIAKDVGNGSSAANVYYVNKATASATSGSASATASAGSAAASATAGSASYSVTGMTTSSSATSYYVTVNAQGGSATANAAGGSATANAGPGTASVTEGYTPGASASGSWNNKSASGTWNNKSASGSWNNAIVYIPASSITNSSSASGATVTCYVNGTAGYTPGFNHKVIKSISSGSAATPATTVYTGAPTVTINASNGYVTAAQASKGTSLTPSVTAGYISAGTAGTVTAKSNVSGLQLSTNAGGTTTITGNTLIVQANNFVTGNRYATVTSGSATTPATTVYTGAPTVTINASNGYVTAASKSGTKSVTPTVSAGYVSAGTAGTITATSNVSGLQLSTSAGGTTTITGNTLIIAANTFATGAKYATVSTTTHPAPVVYSMTNASGVVTYKIKHEQGTGYVTGGTTWTNGTYSLPVYSDLS